MPDLRTLKDRAAELVASGELGVAAELYREALAGDPRDVATRQRLAEVLRRAGRTSEAIAAYRAVAERYAADGLLAKAIAIAKAILELEPAHEATQAALAHLYARKATAQGTRPPPRARAAPAAPARHDRAVAIPLGPGPVATATSTSTSTSTPTATPTPTASSNAPSPRSLPRLLPWERECRAGRDSTGFTRIVSAAEAARAAGVEEEIVLDPEPTDELPMEDEPPAAPAPAGSAAARALPRVPIFSDLSRDAFVALAGATTLRRAVAGERVVEEGDEGASLFVVASGTLSVSRRDDRGDAVTLARLGEGDFFGEMALLSGAPRSATVTADSACELLELAPDALLAIAARHPHLAASLRRFYRQRLLANAMAVSPIFRPFGKGDRKLVMQRFRARPVEGGEIVVREGEPSDGLYVVLDGTLEVRKRKVTLDVVVGELGAGDLFGEMSCLRKAPASATVLSSRAGTLLRLPRAEFDELVSTHPQVLEALAELSDERAERLDAILSGRAQWADGGLVLV